MRYLKRINEINSVFLVGSKVKLIRKAREWTSGNSTTPQYVVDGLTIGGEYIVGDITPVIPTVGGDQQYLSLENMDTTYPTWCFELL